MRVSLIKNNQIRSQILPNKVFGNYWITDYDSNGIEYNLISIEAAESRWLLISNSDAFCVNNEMIIEKAELKNFAFYPIKNKLDSSTSYIYASPTNESYIAYNITEKLNTGITIGKSETATIKYNYLDDVSAQILKQEEKIYIMDNNSKMGVYVNNFKIDKKYEIKIGDIIFITGVKFIVSMYEGNILLYVNNPNNLISVNGLMLASIDYKDTEIFDEEELEMNLYTDESYFHKTPRFVSLIQTKDLKIDSPPGKENQENNSLLMTIGPMLTMSMTSMVTGYTAVNNVLNEKATWATAAPSLVISGAMFASIFLWPLVSKKMEKKRKKENEKKRQEKYGEYIDKKRKVIAEELKNQQTILLNNYPNIAECEKIILNKYTSLWQRRVEDSDFLNVNLGFGNYPMKINIVYPEDHFSMEEDNLKEELKKIGSEPNILNSVPVVYSFLDNYISAIIGKNKTVSEYTKRLLLQLFTFQSYDDLKIIILTDKKNEHNWTFLKDLPHLFNEDKSFRYFATSSNEYKEVCYNLDRIFSQRKESKINDPRLFKQNYLVITDCFKNVRNYDVINNILEEKINYGFSFLILDEKVTNLPDQCQTFMEIDEKSGRLFTNISNNEVQEFNVDLITTIDFDKCIQKLANIPIESNKKDEGQLPNKLSFLEMYDVGKVEQLNSLNRWQKNNPMLTLQAAVGYGKSGEKINIDLHEKYHGPHGLIAGMTGSGKSEFIITYILSMAVNYHPDEVQFILIDYKGGGLAGAFENPNTGIKLPHLVGTITNLDANEIKRSLASIESELKRRQREFNKAREISGESTIDIYKYQKMYREGIVKTPVSHLFIISDEFAELKNQQPEFMEQLISTARIGRSLGVHLILATQKPSGVVDPQIWSNTRFRVCLRVQEKSDSMEVIKQPDAAFLKQTGRFYFQVGYNEVFALGQAAWAGAQYFPSEKVKRTIDTTINYIDNIAYIEKTIDTREKQEFVKSSGEELVNIVTYLSNLAKVENIKPKPLWLEKISSFITVDGLMEKYSVNKNEYELNPVIGEYDIPSEQSQNILTIPFENGNVLVYGAAGAGKENFITSLIYSTMVSNTPNSINYYLIDFGSGALKTFDKCNLVGDVLTVDQPDKISNLFKKLSTTIEERKKEFAKFNGEYKTFIKNSEKKLPAIVVIINNYEAYQETYANFDDQLVILTRDCIKYGIYFLITVNTSNGVRFKLKQNFSQLFSLQQNSEEDYVAVLGSVNKIYPSKIFGRGIIKRENVYEFQTALITEKDEIQEFLNTRIEEFNNKNNEYAPKVPVLPEVITREEIISNLKDEPIIGIGKEDLEMITYNFNKSDATVISTLDLDITSDFISSLINESLELNKTSLLVINAEELKLDQETITKYQYVNLKFNEIFMSLHKFTEDQNKIFKENNYDKTIFKNKKPIQCIIIGLESFKNKLSDENKLKFSELFTNSKDMEIINFIFVDTIDKFKKLELESWFKNITNLNEGIWIGSGLNDQFTIKLSNKPKEIRDEIPYGFGFVIKKGKGLYVKFLQNYKIK